MSSRLGWYIAEPWLRDQVQNLATTSLSYVVFYHLIPRHHFIFHVLGQCIRTCGLSQKSTLRSTVTCHKIGSSGNDAEDDDDHADDVVEVEVIIKTVDHDDDADDDADDGPPTSEAELKVQKIDLEGEKKRGKRRGFREESIHALAPV